MQATDAGRRIRVEGRKACKRAQLALDERLGLDRVTALHALIDECVQCLDEAGRAAR